MRVSKGKISGCRWRPPTDMGPQVWFTSTLSRLLIFHVLKEDGTVNVRLIKKVTTTVPAKRKPTNGVYTVDITINPLTGLWCRVFVPTWVDPDKKLPLIIYFHGGGFVLFCPDLKEFDTHCRHLSKMCEAIVVSVAYRRAPENKYPAAYEDGLVALEWVKSQCNASDKDFPVDIADLSRVFIAGDSAGGNIAHHVAAKAGSLDISPLIIDGLILIQPLFGGEERTASEVRYRHGRMCELAELDWYWRAFLPPGSDRDHPSCNICGPKSPAFLSINVPKILVVAGGKCPLQDRQIQYAEAMQSAGKDCKLVFYDRAFHGFYAFRGVRATTLLHDEIEEFVNPPTATDDSRSMAGTIAETATPRASSASRYEPPVMDAAFGKETELVTSKSSYLSSPVIDLPNSHTGVAANLGQNGFPTHNYLPESVDAEPRSTLRDFHSLAHL